MPDEEAFLVVVCVEPHRLVMGGSGDIFFAGGLGHHSSLLKSALQLSVIRIGSLLRKLQQTFFHENLVIVHIRAFWDAKVR
ncbi:hypothetical protein D9M68_186540 [compost metagenome]